MHRFRQLKVYQRSLQLTKVIRQVTKSFPKDEQFVLTSQFRRAGDSIVLNIAESGGSKPKKEFSRFLSYSIRSGYECVGCIDIALTNGYINDEKHSVLDKEIHEILAMLVGLQQSLTN